jgi:D-alanine--poly(phosphoribitol) ligase subunit 2
VTENALTLQRITELVLHACTEHNAVSEPDRLIDLRDPDSASLYGSKGVLDSLGLVSLLAAIELAIEEDSGVQVTLADARAFSQERSPFRTVASLAAYTHGLCGGARD